ncbi:MAG: hypothetical protein IIT65_04505, partial [Lachnospiraceae bacterium]|nr:hypothetical protein [Lachnospiraceae bacterium]
IGNDGNNYKEVEQYDLDGNYIKTYKSSYEAEKMTGVGRTCIGGCCRNEHHTAGGYIWKFKKEIEEDKKIPTLKNLNLTKIDINKEGQVYGVTKKEMIADIQTLQKWINKIIDKMNKE